MSKNEINTTQVSTAFRQCIAFSSAKRSVFLCVLGDVIHGYMEGALSGRWSGWWPLSQLRALVDHTCGPHLGTTLGTTLGEHTWGPHLGTTLGDHTWGTHLGTWDHTLGLGDHTWGPHLGTCGPNLGDQIWGGGPNVLGTKLLGDQFWGPHLGTTLGDHLWLPCF